MRNTHTAYTRACTQPHTHTHIMHVLYVYIERIMCVTYAYVLCARAREHAKRYIQSRTRGLLSKHTTTKPTTHIHTFLLVSYASALSLGARMPSEIKVRGVHGDRCLRDLYY